ncbi:MAG: B12-binding domain-containing radical SAM protein [Hyphomicrobiales bacterium]|nr:MAG: B12-binding domain-containing radical SAM protein [Hyphomicrobiales bacterium]
MTVTTQIERTGDEQERALQMNPLQRESAPIRIAVCQSGSLGQVQVMRLMHPNIDVIHVAGFLRHEMSDCEVRIIDGYATGFAAALEELSLYAPDVVFLHGDTPTATFSYALADALAALDARPRVIAIFGEHVSALTHEAFERSACDLVMLGDAEPVALAVCEQARQGQPDFGTVENLIYRGEAGQVIPTRRTNAAVDLDTLPPAARDLIDLPSYPGTFYKLSDRETSVLAARGCPWRCSYCGPAWHRALDKPRLRYRSAASLVDELERVQRDHGIDDFMIDITTFNFSKRWAQSVSEEIIGRGLKVNLKTHLRADRVDPETLRLMRAAGFWMIYLGIESANDRSLAGVTKQITMKQVEDALVEIRKADILVVAELMNLLFWEEDGALHHEGLREALSTLRFARRMHHRGLIHAMYWTAMTPIPASESYAVALRHNLIPPEVQGAWHLWFPIQRPIARLPGVPTWKWFLIQWIGKAQQTYFMLNSRALHPSLVGLVLHRAVQFVKATGGSVVGRAAPDGA